MIVFLKAGFRETGAGLVGSVAGSVQVVPCVQLFGAAQAGLQQLRPAVSAALRWSPRRYITRVGRPPCRYVTNTAGRPARRLEGPSAGALRK